MAVIHPDLRLTNSREIYGRGDLELVVIESPLCKAVLALQGAQLLSFTPQGERDLLWLSEMATLRTGSNIRGGVPICAPWFGVASDPEKPRHGFVRNRLWTLMKAQSDEESGELLLTLRYASVRGDADLYRQSFDISIEFRLGKRAEFNLRWVNRSKQMAIISWAMHSYFAVDNVRTLTVEGLTDWPYQDATQDFSVNRDLDVLRFAGETDRVFCGVGGAQRILAERTIRVSGENCPTVITWNPGPDSAMDIPDVQALWSQFVCVERGAAFGDAPSVAPSQAHTASMIIELA